MLSVLDRRRFIGRLAAGLAATAWLGRPKAARADTTGIGPFIGEIMLISCNFPPKGWAFCNGQLLPINQNQALFSLLGTNYGGDGRVTFALPDLRDRLPLHFGQGPGLTLRSIGERQGESAHTLTLAEAPAHAHGVRASSALGTAVSPTGMVPAKNPAQYPQYAAGPDLVMSTSAIGGVGGSQAHPNVQPCLGLYYCIALVGVYPSQS